MIDAITYLHLVVGSFCVAVLLGVALGFHVAMDLAMRHAKSLEVEQERKLRAA
jgi:hypothetical protein